MLSFISFLKKHDLHIFFNFVMLLVLFLLLKAQFTDQAFFTFRIIDNLWDGFGLRWNIDERVQLYSHPLWLLSNALFYPLFFEATLVSTAVSAFCMVAAFLILASAVKSALQDKILLLLLPFALCPSLLSYTFSGMELPLSFLLIALFIREFFTAEQPAPYRLLLITTLLMLTGPAHMVVVLPALAITLFNARHSLRPTLLLLAVLPAILWYGFSLLYYGFLFANSHYDYAASMIPLSQQLLQGTAYLSNFVLYDFPASILLLGMLVFMLNRLYRKYFTKQLPPQERIPAKHQKLLWLLAGVVLQLLYTVWHGGDSLPGFMMLDSVFIGVFALYVLMRKNHKYYNAYLCLALLNLYIVMSVFDYAKFYQPEKFINHYSWADLRSVSTGKTKTPRNLKTPSKFFVVEEKPGLSAYTAGPNTVFVSSSFAVDPLIVRANTLIPSEFEGSHFEREIPLGYAEARSKADYSQMDGTLKQYYTRLHLLNTAPLLNGERLLTLLGFQLWWYDEFINDYIKIDSVDNN